MPIDITQSMQDQNISHTYSPKFFSNDLTGTGGSVGFFDNLMHPLKQAVKSPIDMTSNKKKYVENGNVSQKYIPLAPCQTDMYATYEYFTNLENYVSSVRNPATNTELIFYVKPYSALIITKQDEQTFVRTKQKIICYEVVQAYIDHNKQQALWCNPTLTTDLKQTLKYFFNSGQYSPTEKQDIYKYLDAYDVYNEACLRSQEYQEHISDMICQVIDADQSLAIDLCSSIEQYKIGLGHYIKIYNHLKLLNSPKATLRQYLHSNLHIQLAYAIEQIDKISSKLPCIKTSTAVPKSFYSPEQKAIITAKDPLIIAQAGAGTGKSSTLLGRIDYMIDSGIDPEKILVLSFTNAAADNIKERNPKLHSMTIASMLHTIYSTYFNHELSNIVTLKSSIVISQPNNDLAHIFKTILTRVQNNEKASHTELNNFVQDNQDWVINTLNTLKQTCFELEMILCYQLIDKMSVPPEVSCEHIIIDEVQDNSIFEFIYLLMFATKYKCSLALFGDCSQTLFEFRSSNPKALNLLESTNVFATYKLQTNYRSNQAILDFANIVLKNIEANQFANIQLTSNMLKRFNKQEFQDIVRVCPIHVSKIAQFEPEAPALYLQIVKPYILECLDKQQQVCLLAHSRRNVDLFKRLTKAHFPNHNIVDLTPARVNPNSVISSYIYQHWDQTTHFSTKSLRYTIMQDIINKTKTSKDPQDLQTLMLKWGHAKKTILDELEMQYNNQSITKAQYFEGIKQTLIDFEIDYNAMYATYIAAKNTDKKDNQDKDNAHILLSTIHSAKGLEFDNTVILYTNTTKDPSDETKRMYYVAFTRAIHSELILALDTKKHPQVAKDYEQVLAKLPD